MLQIAIDSLKFDNSASINKSFSIHSKNFEFTNNGDILIEDFLISKSSEFIPKL